MSDDPGLFVCVGDFARRIPGWLSANAGDDADVPFRPGDEFPFEDRGVDVLDCGDFVGDLPHATRVRFLHECRRVLKPCGLLSLRVANPAADADANSRGIAGIAHDAALTGLEAANVAPVAHSCRNALAVRHAHDGRTPAVEYTKRDRGVAGDPLVSIVIPAFTPHFFAAAFDSALAQTYPNVEIVVCDDSGGTEIEALTRAAGHRRNVRYLRNPVRLRPRGNFIKCFESARGEFVKFLCDDDLLAPTCVASLLDAFRRAPDIALATSHRRRIDEYGNVLADQPATQPIAAVNTIIAGHTLANAMVIAGLNTVGEPTTVLFRKADLLDQAPDYFHFNGVHGHGVIDMVMWCALLLKGDAVYLTESLSTFRIHAAQRQHDPKSAQRNIASIRELQAMWLGLGFCEHVPAHLMLARLFPAPGDADWQLQPVLAPSAIRHSATAGNLG